MSINRKMKQNFKIQRAQLMKNKNKKYTDFIKYQDKYTNSKNYE